MSDLQRILAAYSQVISEHAVSPDALHARKMAPGFSGAPVYRIVRVLGVDSQVREQSCYCLKRVGAWPRSPAAIERDGVVRAVSQFCPSIIAPLPSDSGQLSVSHKGNAWQLTKWFDGIALSTRPSDAHCHLAGRAIAEVHAALARHPDHRKHLTTQPAGLAERVGQLQTMETLRSQLREACLTTSKLSLQMQGQVGPSNTTEAMLLEEARAQAASLGVFLKRAIDCFASHDRSWQPLISQLDWTRNQHNAGKCVLETGFAWRDLHREQMLWRHSSSGRESPLSTDAVGLIDHEFLTWDFLAMDLSRWAQSFVLPESVLRQTLAGYRERHPFPDRDASLASTLASAADWITIANWLRWLILEQRVFQLSAARIESRLEPILNRLEAG
ncbi:MAG: hypothetical protein AAGD07_22525 [Planctomycetota bacterium]